ncbi:MAG TPA: LacI family DNA-binding transcriptional regulator [Clostridium sp.]|uniref:LacI family DNA-binding transcriptional regulator n=1 Tax=Clostridium sp. TaxID=1506 RepID=UPI002F93FD1E
MKPIIRHIAIVAGVSPGTVSNALNDKKGVSEEKKQLIIKVAKDMGYIKNSSKKDKTQKIIKLIVYKKHGYIVSDTPFFSTLIEGIELQCKDQGYELLISHIFHGDYLAKEINDNFRVSNISGIIILATEMKPEDLIFLKNLDIPIVVIDNYFNNLDFDYVTINNIRGAYKAVTYLAENGHKNIGHLQSSIPINNFLERTQGYKNALKDYGLIENTNFSIKLEPTLEGSYKEMKCILQNDNIELPTAFFADNDIIAFGAIKALKENGIKLPKDISIVGFDDMPFGKISSPRLTTVKVHKSYIGKVAVNRLMEKIKETGNFNEKIEINTELVIRSSVSKFENKMD